MLVTSCQIKKIDFDAPLGLLAQIASNKALRKEISNSMVFSRDLFLQKDMLTLLRVAYQINKDKLIAVYKKNGIDIKEESDLEDLANLYNTGKDKSGALKQADGKSPLVFDVMAIYASENAMTNDELLKALKERRIIFA